MCDEPNNDFVGNYIEWFSLTCRKIKTKVIALTNQNKGRQSNQPNRARANTCRWRQARENVYEQVTIGFGFTSDWLRKWRKINFSSQSQSVAMQNQSNRDIAF